MNFSDLVLNQLLSEYPELSSYILSFQELNNQLEEGSGISAGAVILNINGRVFYLPTVAKAGQIFPFDSLYDAKQESFVPLTKTQVKLLISAPAAMGTPVTTPAQVDRNPSIYNMVVPPKTGKFVYASSSRLVEFLAAMPGHVKQAFSDNLYERPSLMRVMDKAFGMDNVFTALKIESPTSQEITLSPLEIITDGNGLSSDVVKSILEKGYAIQGQPEYTRLAVATGNYNDTTYYHVGPKDEGFDVDLMKTDGSKVAAHVVKTGQGSEKRTVLITENADYVIVPKRASVVAVGQPQKDAVGRVCVLNQAAAKIPPCTLRDLTKGDSFFVMGEYDSFIGPLTAEMVYITHDGVEIKAYWRTESGGSIRILAKDSYVGAPSVYYDKSLAFFNSRDNVFRVLDRVGCSEFVRSTDEAHHIGDATFGKGLLDSRHRLSHDNGRYSLDNRNIGDIPSILRLLIVDHHIEPGTAEDFVKKAQLLGTMTFAMSKEASASTGLTTGIIPNSQGAQIDMRVANPLALPQDPDDVIPQSAMQAMDQAAMTQDLDILESTVIGQLLQNPDLNSLCNEYLPDINLSVDRLGRILLNLRTNISKLSEFTSPDQAFSIVSQIRNVYRQLGDTSLKLKQLAGATSSVHAQG